MRLALVANGASEADLAGSGRRRGGRYTWIGGRELKTESSAIGHFQKFTPPEATN